MRNDQIIASRDGGGFRHYLSTRPIHAGDTLEVVHNGTWIPVRYESMPRNQIGYLVFPDDSTVDVGPDLICRWPERR